MFKRLTTEIHFIFPFSALACDFLLYYVFIYMQKGLFGLKDVSLKHYWRENWLVTIQFYITLYFVYYSIQYFNKKFSSAPNGTVRFINELLLISLVGFMIQLTFRWVFIKLILAPDPNPEFLNLKLRMFLTVCMTFLLVLYVLMTSLRIFRYLQQKQLELEGWQKEYAQSQFDELKNRLNPHFLFNSLSVLTSLVYIDADKAEAFIEKLSKTYRYLLDQRDKDKVPLKKELEFFEGYRYLVEQRFGKKLGIQMQVNEGSFDKELPPHSLMIALEYIVANNAMSAAKPLVVKLFTQDNNLVIGYSCNSKARIESTSEKQLLALKKRYEYLVPHRPMEITSDEEWNTIVYPLL